MSFLKKDSYLKKYLKYKHKYAYATSVSVNQPQPQLNKSSDDILDDIFVNLEIIQTEHIDLISGIISKAYDWFKKRLLKHDLDIDDSDNINKLIKLLKQRKYDEQYKKFVRLIDTTPDELETIKEVEDILEDMVEEILQHLAELIKIMTEIYLLFGEQEVVSRLQVIAELTKWYVDRETDYNKRILMKATSSQELIDNIILCQNGKSKKALIQACKDKKKKNPELWTKEVARQFGKSLRNYNTSPELQFS